MEPDTVKTESNNDGVKTLGDDLIQNQSEVQPHAVNAEKAKTEEKQNLFAELEDRFGNKGFDPKKHVTGKDGKPSLTKLGKLKNRPGRSSSASIVGGIGDTKQGKQDSSQIDQKGDPRQAAIHTVNMLEFIGTTLAGNEWQYVKSDEHGIDERASGYNAFEQYYRAKDIGDFPPGIALAIWAVGYAAPRFTMPKTQSKVSRLSNWFKMKVLSRRMKKQPEDKGGEKAE